MAQEHTAILFLAVGAAFTLPSGPAACEPPRLPAAQATSGVRADPEILTDSRLRAAPASQTAAPSVEPETAALRRALQILLVTTPGWDAPRGTAQRFERSTPAAPLRRVGSPLAVWVGRSGLGWRSDAEAAPPPPAVPAPRKQEGDGRAPAGVLTLGGMWGYGPAAPARVRLPYQAATELDRCVDDAASPYYNQLLRQPTDRPPPWQSAEALRLPTEHYKYLVVLNYNRSAPRRRAGSCIFLHIAPPPGAPTAGCTALAEADLLTVLRWLDPARRPVVVQLPAPALASAGAAWALPRELLSQGAESAPPPEQLPINP